MPRRPEVEVLHHCIERFVRANKWERLNLQHRRSGIDGKPVARVMANISCVLITVIGLFSCRSAGAASDDEIQVYTDSINKPGRVGLELHSNFVLEGNPLPAYSGDIPSQHLLRITPEFSYGLSKSLEPGLYLPVAIAADGNAYLDGWRLRLKFIPPLESQTFFVGINCEYGHVSKRLSESRWNLEVRPIIGFRSFPWLIAFNPVLGWKLSDGASSTSVFSPQLKIQYSIMDGVGIGLEHYADLGPIDNILPLNEQGHLLFAALDVTKGIVPINVGIGRRLTSVSDEWVIKAIFTVPLSAWFQ